MNRLIAVLALISLAGPLPGCASRIATDVAPLDIDASRLPSPNTELNIAGLGPCTDNPNRTLHLNSAQPVTVMVHGCFGSSGLFRSLAQVYAFQGQQAVCFTYNDRDSLMVSSGQLSASLDALSQKMQDKRITVIGHSQGGLISRKALTAGRLDPIAASEIELRLVTISAPFAGIASADHCGSASLRTWSLGLVPLICRIVTGAKWKDIPATSDFIRRPGQLVDRVTEHLEIVTDERGACRTYNRQGVCTKDDYVFGLGEQRFSAVEAGNGVKIAEVKAGHVEIVGDRRVVPIKLIDILQRNGILTETQANQTASFDKLLAKLYRHESSVMPDEANRDSESCTACIETKQH